jgi:hypothetical protein
MKHHVRREHVSVIGSSASPHDTDTQQRLWAESERLTGVTYQFATTAA